MPAFDAISALDHFQTSAYVAEMSASPPNTVSARSFHIGSRPVKSHNLAFWITTQTDAERDLMRSAPELVSEFRQVLLDAGYPATAVPDIGFEFEAQQTVDRDYNGNWWYRVK
jgi:hypothetical protein